RNMRVPTKIRALTTNPAISFIQRGRRSISLAIFCIIKEYASQKSRRMDPMRKAVHYIIIAICVILIFFLYNKALGSIPFMVLAIYLFYFGWKQIDPRKKNTR
ncbi:hypothetical protein GPDM_16021, partial [Planococcus donghaensis MPA1U2]